MSFCGWNRGECVGMENWVPAGLLVFWRNFNGSGELLESVPELFMHARNCTVNNEHFCFLCLRKFLKSLIRKQPRDLLLVIGTGVSAAVAPGIPALCSWRSCIEAVLGAAEQLEVLHPGDVAEFRKKVAKERDLLVVAHDLIRKMSPVSTSITSVNF